MNALPTQMIAIGATGAGGPEVLTPTEIEVPAPARGEVLIRVAAAGVNRPDVLQRMGLYPPPPGAPATLGLEVAGEIVAVGEGVGLEQMGQPVCALLAGGGYAEYAVAPLGQCLPVPETLSMTEAAALPETLFTVWHNLFERGYAAEGDVVLVHGGTSGIGTMAIMLGRLFGLTIIVTAGGEAKCAAALRIGAAHAIDYRAADFVEEVKAITRGRGVDVVIDMIGGDYFARNLDCLADDGRHVSIAAQRGTAAQFKIGDVMRRRLTLTGSTLRARSVEFKSLLCAEIANNVWPCIAEGKLKPVIDRVYRLSEAAEAHRRIDAGEHIGKIVLEV